MADNRFGLLEDALTAPRSSIVLPEAGEVSWYSDTHATGRPLLLLHSINAAPSAFEVAPLFDHFRGSRPVYAPDLPGFGFSERSDREYSPTLYAAAIEEFIDAVIGEPVDALALSTTCEFLARASLNAAEKFRSLVLISPTGLGERAPPTPRTGDRLHRFFTLPLLDKSLYRLLTSRASIRYFLNLNFNEVAPVELIDYACATSRRPGAHHAPYYFLSMKLFTQDAARLLYRPLTVPSLVLYDKDPNVSFEKLPEILAANTGIRAERIAPSRGLPHWEELPQTTTAMTQFWEGIDG